MNRWVLKVASTMVICVATALCSAQQQPTLADIARQKRAEKAKKVFTTEDMRAADAPAPPTEGAGTEKAATDPPADVKTSEAIAAAEAKVADLKDNEAFFTRNIARFEKSIADATEAKDEGKLRIMTETLESARADLAKTAAEREAAEKELEQAKAVAAAAAAAKARRKPARKPAAPKS